MVYNVLLLTLYLLIIGGCLWLFTRHRDRPAMQAVVMVPVSFALYALVHRVVSMTGGDGWALLDDRFLLVFWSWLALWVGWAVRITRRLQVGYCVIGPDGQRWGLVSGWVYGLPVAAAKPMTTIVRAQVRAAHLARQAADDAEAVTALTPQTLTGD